MSILDYLWRGPTPALPPETPEERQQRQPHQPPAPAPAQRSVSAAQDWSPWDTNVARYPTFKVTSAVDEGLGVNVWVYRCATLKASLAASIPWRVQQRDASGVWRNVEGETPLGRLWARPNEHWTRADLIEHISLDLDLVGRSYVSKVRSPTLGTLAELWRLDPDDVTPIRDRERYLAGYEHRGGDSKRTRIAPEDMLAFRLPNPKKPLEGLSPTQAGAGSIDTEVEAQAHQRNSLLNDCRPSGVLAYDRPLNQAQREDTETNFETRFKGGSKAGKLLVLGGKAQYSRISATPVEMDYINSRKLSREEITAVYGVPPVLVGILDRATYSNYETALKVMWQLTMVPWLDRIAQVLTLGLASEYGDPSRLRLVPDYSAVEVLQELDRNTVISAANLHRMGVPLNAINDRLGLGLPRFDHGDVPYLAAGRPLGEDGIPIDDADPNAASTAEVIEDPA